MIVEGDETQEATRLMGEVTSLTTMYLRKDKCCQCVAWPI